MLVQFHLAAEIMKPNIGNIQGKTMNKKAKKAQNLSKHRIEMQKQSLASLVSRKDEILDCKSSEEVVALFKSKKPHFWSKPDVRCFLESVGINPEDIDLAIKKAADLRIDEARIKAEKRAAYESSPEGIAERLASEKKAEEDRLAEIALLEKRSEAARKRADTIAAKKQALDDEEDAEAEKVKARVKDLPEEKRIWKSREDAFESLKYDATPKGISDMRSYLKDLGSRLRGSKVRSIIKNILKYDRFSESQKMAIACEMYEQNVN